MGRRLSSIAGVVALTLVSVAASSQASWAQDDPTRQWFICYGPLAQGRLAPPKTVYVSGVSTAVRVTGQTTVLITEAFHAFAKQKYGADFAPQCDAYSTGEQATKILNGFATRMGGSAVEKSGWVWTQPDSDKAPRAAPTPNPGALSH